MPVLVTCEIQRRLWPNESMQLLSPTCAYARLSSPNFSSGPTRARIRRPTWAVKAFVAPFVSLPFDDSAADLYGQIRFDLQSRGQMIGPNDLMIAAIAKDNGLLLVTHNTSEFSRVPGLPVVDWTLP